MKKRIISLALALIMVFGTMVSAGAFSDISGHWAQKAIEHWEDEEVILGRGDGKFHPNDLMTRQEMVSVISKMYSDPAVDLDAWCTNPGVVTGTNATAAATDALTRQEVITVIAKVAGLATATTGAEGYSDKADIAAWALPYVNAMTAAGYVQGYDGRFNPNGSITRAEVITIIDNMNTALVSKPGVYSGYSVAEYDGYNRYSLYVPVTDGTKIAVDYYIPTKDGVEAKSALPTVFTWTPYSRQRADNVTSAEWFTSYGYAFVAGDVRGMGASYGTRDAANSAQEAQDGADIVAWIHEQSWCNGKIGTIGSSYVGQTQLAVLSKSKLVDASVIGCTDYNKYDGWIRGGIPRAFGSQPDTLWGDTEAEIQTTIAAQVAKGVPVDADTDKSMLTEAISQHVDNGLQIPMFQRLLWRDSYSVESGGEYWNQVSASSNKNAINTSGSAIYIMGGLYDVFRRDSFITYENLTGPKKLTIGPWYHTKAKLDPDWNIEQLRWFDYWLKGIDNGIMDEDPIYLKTANKEANNGYSWHTEWNPSAGVTTTMYLNGTSELVLSDTKTASNTYVDYDAVYGIKTGVESEDASDVESKGLCFTYTVEEDMEITGHSMAHIYFEMMSEGYDDVDFFVSVADYDPATGKSFLFDDGHIRASLRSTEEAPYNYLGLPWHPADESDAQPITTGKVYELVIDLMPTSYIVKEGHELRVTISNSMDRFYYLGRSEYEAEPNCDTPTVRVYTGGKYASYIEFPNIYAKNVVDAPTGTYVGQEQDNGTVMWKGIEFANAERWQAPVLVPESDNVYICDEYGQVPMQDDRRTTSTNRGDDCLNLNIWAADNDLTNKSVYMYIFPGAQIGGDNTKQQWTEFVKENPDIIVVQPNYRAGYWGSLDMSSLEGYEEVEETYKYSNNLGRLDLLACLKWINQNIAAFGGNPDDVTIGGHSAGSNNVTCLLMMEEAHPYFQKAICQASFCVDISLETKETAEFVSQALFEKLGVTTVDELLALSNAEVLAGQNAISSASTNGSSAFATIENKLFSPVIDGVVIPENYYEYLLSGGCEDITVMFGSNAGEYDQQYVDKQGSPLSDEAALDFTIAQNWGKLSERGWNADNAQAVIDEFYSHNEEYGRDDWTAAKDLKNDLYLRCGAIMFAEALSRYTDVYFYHLDWDITPENNLRASHGSENDVIARNWSKIPADMLEGADVISDTWASFIRTGDPNNAGLPVKWTTYNNDTHNTMYFAPSIEDSHMSEGWRQKDVDLLLPLFREYPLLESALGN